MKVSDELFKAAMGSDDPEVIWVLMARAYCELEFVVNRFITEQIVEESGLATHGHAAGEGEGV